MNDYDIYLFDWDGTLTDSMPIWMDIIREETTKLGLALTEAQIHEGTGDWFLLTKYGLDPAYVPTFGKIARAHARARLPKAPLRPGAADFIAHLKRQGKKVGVVTATHQSVMDIILPLHGMQDTFDVVVHGSDITQLKPHPEGVLLALKRLGHNGERAIMWGDASRDLVAAERAGIDSALFFPPHHATYVPQAEAALGAKPVKIIADWQELLKAPVV